MAGHGAADAEAVAGTGTDADTDAEADADADAGTEGMRPFSMISIQWPAVQYAMATGLIRVALRSA